VEPAVNQYDELTQLPSNAMFEAQRQEAMNVETMSTNLAKHMSSVENSLMSESNQYFDEEFDIDVEFEQYERIEVPKFSHGKRGRFVHDFAKNKTGIVDLDGGRCFVLPLNRSRVLPPQSLFDLVLKMRTGYYDIDTQIVRDMYRVVTPPITDFKSLGYYIGRECAKLPTYRLERITSPVYKRSVDTNVKPVVFTEFAGIGLQEIQIVNLNDANGSQ